MYFFSFYNESTCTDNDFSRRNLNGNVIFNIYQEENKMSRCVDERIPQNKDDD